MGSIYAIMFQVFINEVEYDHFCRITKVKFQLKACWTQVILRFSATLFFFFGTVVLGILNARGERAYDDLLMYLSASSLQLKTERPCLPLIRLTLL